MTPRFARSLRHKLMGVILLTTLAALVFALAAIVAYDLRAYHRNWTADMATQAELVGRLSAPAIAFDDARSARENLALLRLRPQVRSAAIYTARGALFASYVRPGSTPRPFATLPAEDGLRIEGSELEVTKRIDGAGEILGTVVLRADYELPARVLDYLGIAFVVMVLAMAMALAMSARLQRVVSTPVLDIADIARGVVGSGDYSRRAGKRSDDEVGALADAFNAMLAEIERRTGELEVSNLELGRLVSERARAEEVLRLNAALEDRVRERTAQLEAANHELEAFSFSVSHDLRAPLRSIDGFSQALLEDFPRDVPEEAQRYLARIRAATLRMGQLIEDLLNLSRVSRGALERMPVDLGEIARQVLADIRQHEPGREVEVSVWGEMAVRADPRLLRAALENLLGNAWKFTSQAERARIEVGVLREGGRQVFFVRDNGAGFSMDYADKLFAPFQRLHSAAEFSGTGIGLATVQRIVYRHGGRIWADARVGSGATFFFTLAPDGEARPEPAPAPAVATAGAEPPEPTRTTP